MKVVACENCGAKYQIEDEESIDMYECSTCAGNLKEIEQYPLVSSSYNKNKNFVYGQNSTNSKVAYCSNCGLKYQLENNENIKDYECSSCYGNLRYVNEDLNKEIEVIKSTGKDRFELDSINNNNNNNKASRKEPLIEEINSQTINKTADDNLTIPKNTGENIEIIEKDLRNYIKNNFSRNLSSEYKKASLTSHDIDQKSNIDLGLNGIEKDSKDHNDIEEQIRRKLKEKEEKNNVSKTSIFDRIRKKASENKIKIENKANKESEKNKTNKKEEKKLEKEKASEIDPELKKEIDSLNDPNAIKYPIEKDSANIRPKKNKTPKQDLVPYPNIKNTSYHDVYIVAGLIVIFIGFEDVFLSNRLYSLIFIAVGAVLFGIGIYKNKNYSATENRGKIIREKLLTLPEKFYVLYFVKVPNANDGINHVVVGPSGIFSILSQNYNSKEDNDKLKTDAENTNFIANSSHLNSNENNESVSEEKTEESINSEHLSESSDSSLPTKNAGPKTSNQTKFKFDRIGQVKFDHNNKIKQKAIDLSEELVNFLNENGLIDCHTEPLVGFVNNKIAVINMPLTDEDLFLEELIQKIIHGERQLDDTTTHKAAVLLSQYSTECSS